MGIVHFLNVKDGDCHIIQHPSGHTTVIDVCNASSSEEKTSSEGTAYVARSLGISGNFNQKAHPTNPITYLSNLNVTHIFRYIQTHPDMDHMDGIRDTFSDFNPINFWDTNNTKSKPDFNSSTKYKEYDWDFYESLRDGRNTKTKRLTLYSGAKGKYFNSNEDGTGGGDGLRILSPTKELLAQANEQEDWNDSSYVVLYKTRNNKILFCGDAHDDTWSHLLETHKRDISNVDVLIAPHHGRDSDMDFSFLDVVNPALTLFGNAKSKHLAYDKWANRNLSYITNNQAGNIILDTNQDDYLRVYVTCRGFAEAFAELNDTTSRYSDNHKAWSLLVM